MMRRLCSSPMRCWVGGVCSSCGSASACSERPRLRLRRPSRRIYTRETQPVIAHQKLPRATRRVGLGWQRCVGSLKCQVSFAKELYFCRALVQKKLKTPDDLGSLLIVCHPIHEEYKKRVTISNPGVISGWVLWAPGWRIDVRVTSRLVTVDV